MPHRHARIEIGARNLAKMSTPMISTLKLIHVGLAIISVAGFVLRGAWMFGRPEILQRPSVRVAPHVVDTAFLISGIFLVVALRLHVLQTDWLLAKLIALVAYIVFGTVALRRGKTIQIRMVAFAAALIAYAYIVGAALNKSPASWAAA